MTVYILYASRHLHVTPVQWGLILGPSSVLALLGSSVTPRLSRRVGPGVTLTAGTALLTVPWLVVPVISGYPVIVVGALVLGGVGHRLDDASHPTRHESWRPSR